MLTTSSNFFSLILIPAIIFAVTDSSFAQSNLISITNSLQYTGDPGPTTVTITIENSGITMSPPALVGVYFSLDATINPTEDSLIWTMPFGAISSEGLLTIDTTINLCGEIALTYPSYIFGEDFYVGYIIDYSNLVAEINEADNSDVFSPQLFIGCTLGTVEPGEATSFTIYPNPNKGRFILSAAGSTIESEFVSVENIIDQEKIILIKQPAINQVLDLSFLPMGLYAVIIQTKGKIFRQLMAIER